MKGRAKGELLKTEELGTSLCSKWDDSTESKPLKTQKRERKYFQELEQAGESSRL